MTTLQSEIQAMVGEISTTRGWGRGGYPLAAVTLLFVDQIQGGIMVLEILFFIFSIWFLDKGRLPWTLNRLNILCVCVCAQ